MNVGRYEQALKSYDQMLALKWQTIRQAKHPYLLSLK